MFCPNCGNQMNDGAQFCTKCGWSKNGVVKGISNGFKSPIILIVGLVAIIAIVFLVKNLFLGGNSFKDVKIVTSYSDDTTIDQMNTIIFGSYYQNNSSSKEPIEWIILDRQGERTLLLSKYILDCKCYNNESGGVTWENCTLRNWLNRDFYNTAFSSSEQNKIEITNVINNNNIDYGTNGGNNTNDRIFCLSIEEIRRYFGSGTKVDYGYQLGKNVATRGTSYAKTNDNGGHTLYMYDGSGDSQYKWATGNSFFWLRSSGNYQDYAADVSDAGYLGTRGHIVDDPRYGVRPALWIKN